jgi:hypothetical protein
MLVGMLGAPGRIAMAGTTSSSPPPSSEAETTDPTGTTTSERPVATVTVTGAGPRVVDGADGPDSVEESELPLVLVVGVVASLLVALVIAGFIVRGSRSGSKA